MARFKFDDYDEYEEMYDDLLEEKRNSKLHAKGGKKGKTKGKGHQSVHNKKAEMHQEFLDSFEENWEDFPKFIQPKPLEENKRNDKPKYQQKTDQNICQFPKKVPGTFQENKPAPAFGVNSHEVKGNMIDFDRVENIEKIENTYNGRQTYGIKFLFTGKKGLFKTIWFNQNARERDSVFNREFGFWKNLQNKKEL